MKAFAGLIATLDKDFVDYMTKHGKSYGTKEEYEMRQAIFQEKKAYVEMYNSQNSDGSKVALNHMADWTQEEYQKILGYKGHEVERR